MVTGVTHDRHVAKITAYRGAGDRPGAAAAIFQAIAARHVNVNMIIQSMPRRERADISFTVAASDVTAAVEAVRSVAKDVAAEEILADAEVAMVSAVGAGMVSNPGVAARMFGALARDGINIELIATSEIKVSCVIRAADFVDRAVRALHAEFGARPRVAHARGRRDEARVRSTARGGSVARRRSRRTCGARGPLAGRDAGVGVHHRERPRGLRRLHGLASGRRVARRIRAPERRRDHRADRGRPRPTARPGGVYKSPAPG